MKRLNKYVYRKLYLLAVLLVIQALFVQSNNQWKSAFGGLLVNMVAISITHV